jgi:hypothetical protein
MPEPLDKKTTSIWKLFYKKFFATTEKFPGQLKREREALAQKVIDKVNKGTIKPEHVNDEMLFVAVDALDLNKKANQKRLIELFNCNSKFFKAAFGSDEDLDGPSLSAELPSHIPDDDEPEPANSVDTSGFIVKPTLDDVSKECFGNCEYAAYEINPDVWLTKDQPDRIIVLLFFASLPAKNLKKWEAGLGAASFDSYKKNRKIWIGNDVNIEVIKCIIENNKDAFKKFLAEKEFKAYKKDKTQWLNDNADKIKRLFKGIRDSVFGANGLVKTAQVQLREKFKEYKAFGRSFFSRRLKVPANKGSFEPQILKGLALKNAGSLLGMLENDQLRVKLFASLTTVNDYQDLLRTAVAADQKLPNANDRIYFSRTLDRLLATLSPPQQSWYDTETQREEFFTNELLLESLFREDTNGSVSGSVSFLEDCIKKVFPTEWTPEFARMLSANEQHLNILIQLARLKITKTNIVAPLLAASNDPVRLLANFFAFSKSSESSESASEDKVLFFDRLPEYAPEILLQMYQRYKAKQISKSTFEKIFKLIKRWIDVLHLKYQVSSPPAEEVEKFGNLLRPLVNEPALLGKLQWDPSDILYLQNKNASTDFLKTILLNSSKPGEIRAYVNLMANQQTTETNSATGTRSVSSSSSQLQRLTDDEALLIAASPELWAQIDPHQRYWVRSWFSKGWLGFFKKDLEEKCTALALKSPIFARKLNGEPILPVSKHDEEDAARHDAEHERSAASSPTSENPGNSNLVGDDISWNDVSSDEEDPEEDPAAAAGSEFSSLGEGLSGHWPDSSAVHEPPASPGAQSQAAYSEAAEWMSGDTPRTPPGVGCIQEVATSALPTPLSPAAPASNGLADGAATRLNFDPKTPVARVASSALPTPSGPAVLLLAASALPTPGDLAISPGAASALATPSRATSPSFWAVSEDRRTAEGASHLPTQLYFEKNDLPYANP